MSPLMVTLKVSSQYDTSARCTRDAMPKRKDRLDCYPCVAYAALDASDFTWHKFTVEIVSAFFMEKPLDAE